MSAGALRRAGRAARLLVRQATGEAKWDEYLDRCRTERREPMTRREFERHRAANRERDARARCC